jgi:magnesium transporter
MRADNPLTREYLTKYPVDSARILEQVSDQHVAAFFSELPVKTGAKVMSVMLPNKAMHCLQAMSAQNAAKLMSELPVTYAVRIYRLMPATVRDTIFTHLSERSRKHIRRYLKYPSTTAGALLDPVVDMLPAEVTVAGAIRAVERFRSAASCDIYIVDQSQHLVGMIEIGKLLKSSRHLMLKDIMFRKTRSISAYAKVDKLLKHPGWTIRRRLPVVDRDNTLVGALDYRHLKDALGVSEETAPQDAVSSLLSFAGLYWLTVAQLIDSVFAIAGTGRGER